MRAPVAVIDIGSNSIKLLVAEKTPEGSLRSLGMKTLEARISAGISRQQPRLSEEGMARGLAAVRELASDAAVFNPGEIRIVATSAVRDAENGSVFCGEVERAVGAPVRVLSGDEEASLIGAGLTCDPALASLRNYYLFDLGGGSLECLAFRDRRAVQATSLALGCVRLTEKFVSNPAAPFTEVSERSIIELTKEVVAKSGFHFNLPPDAVAVGTGGTLTTARAILAARRGKSLEQSESLLTVAELRELLAYVGRFALDERRRLPSMPAARADILPAALATFIGLAELGGIEAYRNSFYNLRWGVASAALAG